MAPPFVMTQPHCYHRGREESTVAGGSGAAALGSELPEDAIMRRPSVPPAALNEPAVAEAFFAVLGWYVDAVTAASAS